jgi:RNA 2',3'-cyclic 3'-phosphodiesterase
LRLFVAAYPPEEAVEHLRELVSGRLAVGQPQPPGRSLRLTRPDTWHVTLAFLGEVADKRAEAAAKALMATPKPSVKLRIAGGGTFGRGRFTTVWAGLHGDVTALHDLAAATRRELKRARLPFDDKPLKAHLTLARPADRLPAEALAADLAALNAYEGPQWTADDVRLVRSYLGPEPRYETVAKR